MSSQMPTAEGIGRETVKQFLSLFMPHVFSLESTWLIPVVLSGHQPPQLEPDQPPQPELRQTKWKSDQPSNTNTQHVQIQLDLPVPAGINNYNIAEIYQNLRQSFLTSYNLKTAEYFEMSVQGLGKPTWHFTGLIMLTTSVHLRSARKKIRKLLLDWHGRVVIDEGQNQAFSKVLESKLVVKSAVERFSQPFSGPKH